MKTFSVKKYVALLTVIAIALIAPARAQTAPPQLLATLPGTIGNNAGDMAFAPGVALGTGGALAVTQPDGAIGIFEPRTGKPIRVIEGFKSAPQKLAFSSDSAFLAASLWTRFAKDSPEAQTEAGKDGAGTTQIRVWNAATGALLQTIDGPNRGVWKLAFWPNDATLATASVIYEGQAGSNRTGNSTNAVIQQWNWKTGALKSQTDGRALDFAPDSQHTAREGGMRPGAGPGNISQIGADIVDIDGKSVPTTGGHSYNLGGAIFSPDSQTLATLGSHSVKLWDAKTGKLQREIEFAPEGTVFNGAFGFDSRGARIAILDYSTKFYDAKTGDALGRVDPPAEFKSQGGPTKYALSNSGKLLAMMGPTSKTSYGVWVYDLTTLPQLGQPLPRLASDAAGVTTLPTYGRALAWKPDGKTLAIGGSTLDFWNPAQRVLMRSLPGTDGAGSLAFSPDGKLVLTGGDYGDTARLWDAETFELKQILGTHEWPIEDVAFSPDGKLAVAGGSGFTGASRAPSLGLVSVWDVASGKLLKTLTATAERVRSLAFSPDGKYLADGCYNGSVDIWQVESFLQSADPDGGKPSRVLRSPQSYGSEEFLIWSSKGGLIGAETGGNIHIWDAATGKVKRELRSPFSGGDGSLAALAISNDGARLAAGSSASNGDNSKNIALFDAVTGAIQTTLKSDSDGVISLAFAPDDKTLASIGKNNTLKIWDLTAPPKL